MTADNTRFDLEATPFQESLTIAFSTSPGNKATHYKVDEKDYNGYKTPRLVLAWHEKAGEGFTAFLAPLTAETAGDHIKAWLKEQNYGSQPDHDGDNGRSFRMYNEAWGYIDHNQYTFVAIEPRWAEYGK